MKKTFKNELKLWWHIVFHPYHILEEYENEIFCTNCEPNKHTELFDKKYKTLPNGR